MDFLANPIFPPGELVAVRFKGHHYAAVVQGPYYAPLPPVSRRNAEQRVVVGRKLTMQGWRTVTSILLEDIYISFGTLAKACGIPVSKIKMQIPSNRIRKYNEVKNISAFYGNAIRNTIPCSVTLLSVVLSI